MRSVISLVWPYHDARLKQVGSALFVDFPPQLFAKHVFVETPHHHDHDNDNDNDNDNGHAVGWQDAVAFVEAMEFTNSDLQALAALSTELGGGVVVGGRSRVYTTFGAQYYPFGYDPFERTLAV